MTNSKVGVGKIGMMTSMRTQDVRSSFQAKNFQTNVGAFKTYS